MEASQGSDPSTSVKNDAAGKILPLHTGAGFDWMEFFVFFVGYISTWHLGYESLTTDWSKVVETAQEKIERLKRYSIANAKVVQTFYQAAIGCLEARQVITQHAQEDPVERNAFTLYQLMKTRFTQKVLVKIQKLLIELNQLIARASEEPAKLIDRFDKFCMDINAIDRAQLPTTVQLIAILINSIKDRFKLLHAVVTLSKDDWTLDKLKEKIKEWESKM